MHSMCVCVCACVCVCVCVCVRACVITLLTLPSISSPTKHTVVPSYTQAEYHVLVAITERGFTIQHAAWWHHLPHLNLSRVQCQQQTIVVIPEVCVCVCRVSCDTM